MFKCVCVVPTESEGVTAATSCSQFACWRISAREDYLLLARDTFHGPVAGILLASLTGLQLDLKQGFGAF